MFPWAPYDYEGKAIVLNAYAFWFHGYYAPTFTISTTIHLKRNAANDGWIGSSGETGNNLQLLVADPAVPGDPHVITLRRRIDEQIHDSYTWYYTQPAAEERFDTRLLTKQLLPGYEYTELHVLG